jgi:hypothetical protein
MVVAISDFVQTGSYFFCPSNEVSRCYWSLQRLSCAEYKRPRPGTSAFSADCKAWEFLTLSVTLSQSQISLRLTANSRNIMMYIQHTDGLANP